MRIILTKRERDDHVEIVPAHASRVEFVFPKKGPIPHDAVHFFVERGLKLQRGFWGLVAGGLHPGQVGAMAAAGGHASAARACLPDAGIIELLQAERLVECFEADIWSGGSDNAAIWAMAVSGWETSLVPPLDLDDAVITAIRAAIADFAKNWAGLQRGQSLALEWEEIDG